MTTLQLESPPGPPKDAFGLRMVRHLQQAGARQMLVDLYEKYGDVVFIEAGPINQFIFTDPANIEYVLKTNAQNYIKGRGFSGLKLSLGNGLFTNDDRPLWRRQRRLMAPPFTPRGVIQFDGEMLAATEAMLGRWQGFAQNQQAFDLHLEMMGLAMNIIARTMFSTTTDESDMGIAEDFSFVLAFAGERGTAPVSIPLWLPLPSHFRFNAALKRLNQFMDAKVNERIANPPSKPDLLTRLLDAADEESGERMTHEQLRNEVLTLFFAGHETTAQALTWTFYLLAENPEWRAEVVDEIDRVLNGRTPSAADMPNLPKVTLTVMESMRLYPPVWGFARDAVEDDVVGGYHVPAGAMITVSQWITQRHPAYWDAPERFDPLRFLPENEAKRHPFAYFPFGGGPRICLGNSFALLELELVTTMVLQRFLPNRANNAPIVISKDNTTRPVGGLPMTLTPRQ